MHAGRTALSISEQQCALAIRRAGSVPTPWPWRRFEPGKSGCGGRPKPVPGITGHGFGGRDFRSFAVNCKKGRDRARSSSGITGECAQRVYDLGGKAQENSMRAALILAGEALRRNPAGSRDGRSASKHR
jgi:hypothetical protein